MWVDCCHMPVCTFCVENIISYMKETVCQFVGGSGWIYIVCLIHNPRWNFVSCKSIWENEVWKSLFNMRIKLNSLFFCKVAAWNEREQQNEIFAIGWSLIGKKWLINDEVVKTALARMKTFHASSNFSECVWSYCMCVREIKSVKAPSVVPCVFNSELWIFGLWSSTAGGLRDPRAGFFGSGAGSCVSGWLCSGWNCVGMRGDKTLWEERVRWMVAGGCGEVVLLAGRVVNANRYT